MNKKEYYAEYYKEHRDELKEYHKKWYQKNKDKNQDKYRAYSKQYNQQNKDKHKQITKTWIKNNKERWHELMRKVNSKRQRELGFVPLNEWFEGSEGHHIDKEFVIYMPKEYHQSVSHNVWTGKNMALINALAYDYLLEIKIAQGGA